MWWENLATAQLSVINKRQSSIIVVNT